MEKHSKGLGLLKAPPDYRDFILPQAVQPSAAPDHVDLRDDPAMPKIFDQGRLGSCTANATNAVVQFVERKDHDPDYDRLSRLWTYWYSREKIGTTGEDSGANIRDSFAVVAERGAPREAFWPYDIREFTVQPSGKTPDGRSLDQAAGQHRAIAYHSIPDGSEAGMVSCLAEGYPFTYGFAVYDTFWDVGDDGVWDGARGSIDGYHAVDAVGYDFRPGAFGFSAGGWIVRNQWATSWGKDGYFFVPRAYMSVEAFDCWTIRSVTR